MLLDNDRQSLRNMYFKSRKFHRYFPYVQLESIDQNYWVSIQGYSMLIGDYVADYYTHP